MRKQNQLLVISFRSIILACMPTAFLGFQSISFSASAEIVKPGEIPKEREIHNTFSRTEKQGTVLDATNPMDLINRLREARSMDNATNPSDAIDEALKAFGENDLNNVTTNSSNP